ncbi:DUF4440 domain-containing protein [Winogradskyella sp. 3972H.M.0a.05]|uniref:YybH family protein n=1 Tax=Winogradskyella sp. 3972H.M.0a.05 TaxID=2950277 RepID=UPI003392EEEE
MVYSKPKYLLLILFAFAILFSCEETSTLENDKKAILNVMKLQEEAWNKHDLEGFMKGYWKNDSLKFYGSSGLTKGWQNTLDNYKRGYPTSAESGALKFTIDDISPIEPNSYWVMGQYHLTRDVGDANGNFLVIFKKIDGQWKIIADMSS